VLVDRLRRNRPTLKVIYMSGYTEDTIISQGAHESGTSFLHKPFIIKDLTVKIRETLRGKDASVSEHP